MWKRISKLIKGTKKQQTEHQTLPSTPSVPQSPTPPAKAKPDLWSWDLLTGTYNPLPDDPDDQSSTHTKDKNKN